MTAGRLFFGFDVGTQGTKAVVVDADAGEVTARAAVSYGLIEGLPPGAAEQHPATWIEALAEVSARLLSDDRVDPEQVGGIGVAGQQHGLVVLDHAGDVVRPAKLWCDTSTADEAAELSARLGRAVPTGFTASKILWMMRNEPADWRRVRHVMLPHDYVNYRLTGDVTSEAGDASGTGFFDVAERRFDERVAEAIAPGLMELLPRLVDPGRPAGDLGHDGARLLGLPRGVPVAAGGGDNMLSALGSGATRPGVVVASLGTSGTVFAHADHPVVDPEGLIAPFCDSTGGWLPLLCVMNLTGVTEEVRAAFGKGTAGDLAALTAEAERVPRGCDGLLWLPYLAGERVPDLPRATGTLLGLRAGSLRPGRLFRAAMEGTSLNLGWGAERLANLGVPVDEVRLVGGAATNPLWRRILADVLDAPIRLLAETESAALGAALQALWTARRLAGEAVDAQVVAEPFARCAPEVVEPDPEGVAVYRELSLRFQEQVARVYADPAYGGRGA